MRCRMVNNYSRVSGLLVVAVICWVGCPAMGQGVNGGLEKVATGAWPHMAVDSKGVVHLVYAREGEMWYRTRAVESGRWSDEQTVGIKQMATYRNDPQVVIDSQDRPHVIGGGTDGQGQYAYRDGERWVVAGEFNRDTSMAIDAQDTIYVIQRGGNQGGFLGAFKRSRNSLTWEALPDPDIAAGFSAGKNNHVYGNVAVSKVDGSIHIVYRHATPTRCGYRGSNTGGEQWFGGGILEDDAEGPYVMCDKDGRVFMVSGRGYVFRRQGTEGWMPMGHAVDGDRRLQPYLCMDAEDNLYVSCFGGQINVCRNTKGKLDWAGQSVLPSSSGQKIGFVRLAGGKDFVYAVWEEGADVVSENHDHEDKFGLVFARIGPDGKVLKR